MTAEQATSPIVIVEYDPAWPVAYATEERRLRNSLGEIALRIDHVGSTSVAGISAKPIIDIQISVENLHPLAPHRARLAQAGYHYFAYPDDVAYPFFHKPRDWPHTHHVHVCTAGGSEERRHLAFCAYLRDHPQLAQEYGLLKRRLAEVHSAATMKSRNAYADAKSDFIRPLIDRALAEGYPR